MSFSAKKGCSFVHSLVRSILFVLTISSVFLPFPLPPFNRFFDMVNSITEEIGKTTEEGECDGDSLEVFLLLYLFVLPQHTIWGF